MIVANDLLSSFDYHSVLGKNDFLLAKYNKIVTFSEKQIIVMILVSGNPGSFLRGGYLRKIIKAFLGSYFPYY